MNPAFTFLFVYAMHPAEKNRQEVAHMSHPADAYVICTLRRLHYAAAAPRYVVGQRLQVIRCGDL